MCSFAERIKQTKRSVKTLATYSLFLSIFSSENAGCGCVQKKS